MATPGLDQDAGLGAAAEPFERQALVAELAVEALGIAVLPRLARIDERGFGAGLGKPSKDRVADELGAVVGSKVARCAMLRDQPREHLDHARRADRATDVDRQALLGVLVDHRQALDLLAAGAGIEYEVVGPDLIGTEYRQGPRA